MHQETTKFGKITQSKGHCVIQGHWFCTDQKLIYDFLLVINTNLPPVLHHFWDMASESSKIAYFATPLAFYPPMEGFPWDDLRKIFRGCQRMTKVTNGIEILLKISTRWIARTNVTDDRQTDGRAIAYSEREFSFAENHWSTPSPYCTVSIHVLLIKYYLIPQLIFCANCLLLFRQCTWPLCVCCRTRNGIATLWRARMKVCSLQYLCRLAIRRLLPTDRIDGLNVPDRLKQFLCYAVHW